MGTTNHTFRVLGKTAGTVVLFMDILKGTLATALPVIFHVTSVNPLWFGCLCDLRTYISDLLLSSKVVAKQWRQVPVCC